MSSLGEIYGLRKPELRKILQYTRLSNLSLANEFGGILHCLFELFLGNLRLSVTSNLSDAALPLNTNVVLRQRRVKI